jgi:hypothetical protein
MGYCPGIPFVAKVVLGHELMVALEGAGRSSCLYTMNVVECVDLVELMLRAVCSRATARGFIHFLCKI